MNPPEPKPEPKPAPSPQLESEVANLKQNVHDVAEGLKDLMEMVGNLADRVGGKPSEPAADQLAPAQVGVADLSSMPPAEVPPEEPGPGKKAG